MKKKEKYPLKSFSRLEQIFERTNWAENSDKTFSALSSVPRSPFHRIVKHTAERKYINAGDRCVFAAASKYRSE